MSLPSNSATGAATSSRAERRRGLLLPTIAAGLAFLVLVALGSWQLVRLEWKNTLIERATAQLVQAARDWPVDLSDPAILDFMRVAVDATLLPDGILFQPGGSPGGRAGLRVLVAAKLEGASADIALIDLGWIPLDLKSASVLLPEGPLHIEGVLRAPEEPNMLTPENSPGLNMWYTIDPVMMAQALDVPSLPPVVLRAERITTADGTPTLVDYPERGPAVVEIANNHMQYAVTWFALAVGLVVVFGLFVRAQRRERRSPPP